MIDIESIDPYTLPSVNFNNFDEFPSVSGIYFVIDDQKTMYYIGMSKNIKGRWRQHHRKTELLNTGKMLKLYFLQVEDSFLEATERFFIKKLKPLLNRIQLTTTSRRTSINPVVIDISKYWPKNADGTDQSVNSVYESIEGTDLEVGRNTLRLAKTGQLDRGLFDNVFKLRILCSKWVDEEITLPEIFQVED